MLLVGVQCNLKLQADSNTPLDFAETDDEDEPVGKIDWVSVCCCSFVVFDLQVSVGGSEIVMTGWVSGFGEGCVVIQAAAAASTPSHSLPRCKCAAEVEMPHIFPYAILQVAGASRAWAWCPQGP